MQASNSARVFSRVIATGLPPQDGSSSAISVSSSRPRRLDAHRGQVRGDRQLGPQLHHPRAEAVEAARDAQIGGGAGQPVLDRGAVEVQHHRHDHRVRGAVMGAIDRADRVAERVDRAQPLLEGDRAHRRRAIICARASRSSGSA